MPTSSTSTGAFTGMSAARTCVDTAATASADTLASRIPPETFIAYPHPDASPEPSPRFSRSRVASLPLEPRSRRIVRAVNLRMAVLARVRDHEPRPRIARLRVTAERMALLAQARPRHVEHVFVVGAVR